MKNVLWLFLGLICYNLNGQTFKGFLDFEWSDSTGELILQIPLERIGEQFLYVNALSAGVGSNDIGLDRGQLGDQRLVSFYKSGRKLLLIEENLEYRAESDNSEEVKAVEEAFAKSTIWGFKIKEETNGIIKIDMVDFLLRDAHNIISTLSEKKQGTYKLDKEKSAIYVEGLFNFPQNSEFEAILTYSGNATGDYIKSVTPSDDLVSVRQHHSFIELPDNQFDRREFKPDCGYYYLSYLDYANKITQDIRKRFIYRHRLTKKNPQKAVSEPLEQIVYYLDRGCPEPVRSALIEGASWWNEAFEEAGYKDAFLVKDLPKDAHPLDVRYNMIQWVHRSRRGWSYGSSISDPRTGEILKGHVSLGSLRVRQDYLIAQGIVSSFDSLSSDPRLMELALARLRQLSAHEVGHTIGLTHNFAASYNDRASVMDYPHPYIELNENGELDLSRSYDVGIGDWDKRAIIYGYGQVPEGVLEDDYLNGIIEGNRNEGYKFITDQDARPKGGLHPYAHLWDNGKDAIAELNRIVTLRSFVLSKLGSKSIPRGIPYSEIEKVLVPAYLMHRYQVEAVSKLIGGVDFSYEIKGDSQAQGHQIISQAMQEKALVSLLSTLEIDFLKMPPTLIDVIPPSAFGYDRNNESFVGHTGSLLDPLAAAEASANHTFSFLFDTQRLARIYNHSNEKWNLNFFFQHIINHVHNQVSLDVDYGLMLEKLCYIHLLKIAGENETNKQISAIALKKLQMFFEGSPKMESASEYDKFQIAAHQHYLSELMKNFLDDATNVKLPKLLDMPPGSPIGCH